MSIRCAMCGSKNVYIDSKKEGYNLKAGAIGTVLVGVPGALAGAVGNENTYYHCRECGQTLNKPMMDFESDCIDGWIRNSKHHYDELKRMKRKYKNIEWEEGVCSPRKKILVRPEFAHLSPLNRWKQSIYAELQENNINQISEESLISMIEDSDGKIYLKHMELAGMIVREKIGGSNWIQLVTDSNEMKIKSESAKKKYNEIEKKKKAERNSKAQSLMPQYLTYFKEHPEEIFTNQDLEFALENERAWTTTAIRGQILNYLVEDGSLVREKNGYCLPDRKIRLEEKRKREIEETNRRKAEIEKKNIEIRDENERIEKKNAEINEKINEIEKEKNDVNGTISANEYSGANSITL